MLPAGRPAWTIEGRLLPEAKPAPSPEPGRYDFGQPDPHDEASEYDEAVFAFPPAARVGFSWEPRRPLSVLVRLGKRAPSDSIDPAALDRGVRRHAAGAARRGPCSPRLWRQTCSKGELR